MLLSPFVSEDFSGLSEIPTMKMHVFQFFSYSCGSLDLRVFLIFQLEATLASETDWLLVFLHGHLLVSCFLNIPLPMSGSAGFTNSLRNQRTNV